MKKFLILLIIFLFLRPGLGVAGIIVNPDVAVESPVSRYMLLSIFSMRLRTWPDGQEIRVFILPEQFPSNDQIIKSQLGIFPYQLQNIWDRLVFSGAGQAPVVVASPQDMLEKISSVPGAIGYTTATITGEQNVKVLQVD
ncbi:hypothetical protein ACFVYJ_11465 [Pontibacter sp. JAM-7]|uniref:hypothetical protein n=1 Tax=Pontibacter sp. JAM-7 TaxID=3366581 RepID=UPI003AF4FF70